jgi:exodeoxyribonuclease-5
LEDEIAAGDQLMVVKNNYHWLDAKSKAGFIANGDLVELRKITKVEEIHGFRFATVIINMMDYPNEPDIECLILLDTITAESPALTTEQSNQLFQNVRADYMDILDKRKHFKAVFSDKYLNALQVKFGYAITCHKAQGGQWPCVFIDQGYLTDEMVNKEFLRWLYTAFTRASEKLFLVNFNERFIEK